MDIDNVELGFSKREFLAVLIAGFGNELLPLTSDYGEEPCPKALLPVANKPLLEYVLSWLEQSGIKDVLLICPAIHQPALYHHIHSDISSSSLRIDLQTYEETQESTAGTCELLRHFSSRITEDFVLVPCDFITPPTLPLSILLNKFRVESTTYGAIATSCWYPAYIPEKGTLSDEWGPTPSPPAIVWDEKTGSLLYTDTADDRDKNGEDMEIKMDLLSRFPHTKLSSSFQDSHVYVCQRKLLTLLQQKPRFESFRQDFIPWLSRIQYQPKKREKYARVLSNLPTDNISQSLSLKHSTSMSSLTSSVSAPAKPNNADNSEQRPSTELPSFKVSIVIHLSDTNSALRINTIYNFLEINRRFLSNASYSLPTDPKNRSLIDQKTQISTDTIVGDSTQISERTTIKRSVIGRHCVIGKNVKISGCILFDHCIIEDGVKLDGCILGKNTKVGARSELARCITCGGFEVNSGDVLKGERLDISDWAADPEQSMSQETDGETSDDSTEES